MKFKDFTQEAYDDIQSYMGGEEQWEEINKTYGVVETITAKKRGNRISETK